MLTEADILEALRVCYDPDLQINIVDLGRVHSIGLLPDLEAPGVLRRFRVRVALLARGTEDAEQKDAMLAATVTNRLLGLRELSRAEVHIAETPAWTADRMTAAGRAALSKQRGLVQLS